MGGGVGERAGETTHRLSPQARSHSQIQGTSTTYLSSAGGRSRLPFEDVLKLLTGETARTDGKFSLPSGKITSRAGIPAISKGLVEAWGGGVGGEAIRPSLDHAITVSD